MTNLNSCTDNTESSAAEYGITRAAVRAALSTAATCFALVLLHLPSMFTPAMT